MQLQAAFFEETVRPRSKQTLAPTPSGGPMAVSVLCALTGVGLLILVLLTPDAGLAPLGLTICVLMIYAAWTIYRGTRTTPRPEIQLDMPKNEIRIISHDEQGSQRYLHRSLDALGDVRLDGSDLVIFDVERREVLRSGITNSKTRAKLEAMLP
ncbi:hypothetical protein SAMN05421688_0261 [Poseidonocella pacifica]|uniref:Uncharacterized protein n=2 Tax=Poseidonocella pacifica TaxID=871651 RepID=A0A1I0V454_9RHOB|nr:hypothetical protein SAMN05421688_0261 [Poseidonocella pacifica]